MGKGNFIYLLEGPDIRVLKVMTKHEQKEKEIQEGNVKEREEKCKKCQKRERERKKGGMLAILWVVI